MPPALMAATPVGAVTAIFLKLFSRMNFRNVVFPVPAFPVRKTERDVWFTNFTASSNTGLCGSDCIRLVLRAAIYLTGPIKSAENRKMAGVGDWNQSKPPRLMALTWAGHFVCSPVLGLIGITAFSVEARLGSSLAI